MNFIRSTAVACLGALFLSGCADKSFPTAIDPVVATGTNVLTGWVFGRGGQPMPVRYEVIGGMSIYQGDINLGPAGSVPETREQLVGRSAGPRYGVVIDDLAKRWGSGKVPYTISSWFNSTQRQTILDAMAHIAATTAGTQFVAHTNEASRVTFELHSELCNSNVGRQGGEQVINLTSGCAYDLASVAHEMLHALGMWHEQSRCDREEFIIIHPENIQSGKAYNFDAECTGSSDVLSYSEPSIMHYGRYAFSSNGLPTISSRRGLDHLIGAHNGQLQQSDRSTVNTIYQPYGLYFTSVTYPNGTPTLAWDAKNTATSYSVDYVVYYEEYDDVNGTSYITETSRELVGSTTNLSLVDAQRSYTGRNDCLVYRDINGTAGYYHYYEPWAWFADGIGSKPGDRAAADVVPRDGCI